MCAREARGPDVVRSASQCSISADAHLTRKRESVLGHSRVDLLVLQRAYTFAVSPGFVCLCPDFI